MLQEITLLTNDPIGWSSHIYYDLLMLMVFVNDVY